MDNYQPWDDPQVKTILSIFGGTVIGCSPISMGGNYGEVQGQRD